jgi:hypothetical protein
MLTYSQSTATGMIWACSHFLDIYLNDDRIPPIMDAILVSFALKAKAKPQPASAPSVIGSVGSFG